MRLYFKAFDSKMASREKLFKAATEFANKLGKEKVFQLTHSEDRDNIVITIWYWSDEEEKEDKQKGSKVTMRAPAAEIPGAKPAAPAPLEAAKSVPPLSPGATPARGTPPVAPARPAAPRLEQPVSPPNQPAHRDLAATMPAEDEIAELMKGFDITPPPPPPAPAKKPEDDDPRARQQTPVVRIVVGKKEDDDIPTILTDLDQPPQPPPKPKEPFLDESSWQ